MGVSVPWKEKHFLIFKDIISDGTSPVPIYHLVQALLCKASGHNADKAAQPGSHAAKFQRTGPEPQIKMAASKPHMDKRVSHHGLDHRSPGSPADASPARHRV